MEKVLGVDRKLIDDILITDYGYIEDFSSYQYIKQNLIAKNRELAEIDLSFKQVIPYLLIQHKEVYLLYKRTKKQTEKRLHEKLSLGIGGHINPIDNFNLSDNILECLNRELNEEISIRLVEEPEFMGFINDDKTEVGKVHLAFVFRAFSTSKTFDVKETEKMKCEWVSKKYIIENYDRLETWSQIVFDSLIK